MNDLIITSLKNNKLVIWEEVARDGAQAKTILNGSRRVAIARIQAQFFGKSAPEHLVFAAGFPSIGKMEFETIRFLVNNFDDAWVASNGRALPEEIDLCLRSVAGAKYPRIAFVVPGSDAFSEVMMHKTLKQSLTHTLDLAKYAVDKANGVPVDLQFADAVSGSPELLAETALKLTEAGIATVGIGDSVGKCYPMEIASFFKRFNSIAEGKIHLSTHFHNDLGNALMNNIEAIKQNIHLITTSWLGLGERSGLLPTELFLFLMSYERDKLISRYGINGEKFFSENPDLKKLVPAAEMVSDFTQIPLHINDLIAGTGVNSISTGTPFVNPHVFQPFDAEEVLGVQPKVFLTHLANKRIVQKITTDFGYRLNDNQLNAILEFVKEEAYNRNNPILPNPELIQLVQTILKQ